MINILDGLAAAAKNKMNFGGVVPIGNEATEYGRNFRAIADGVFGDGASKQLFLSTRPNFNVAFNSVRELEMHRGELWGKATVYCPEAKQWNYDHKTPTSMYYTGELQATLRRPLELRPLSFAPGRPSVGVHVRRGDLHPGTARAPPDTYYYEKIELIRQHLPNADIHVWSSVNPYSSELEAGKRWRTSEDFEGYRKRGAHVHLDGDTLLDQWAHLSRAHVLVTSGSSFSYVPAILNPNCVIHCGADAEPLDNWISGEDKKLDTKLRDCIRELRSLPSTAPTTPTPLAGPPPPTQFCSLRVCTLHGARAPRLFVAEHGDGAGHRMKNILEGMATAQRNGMNFGGALPVGNIVTEHGHNFRTITDGIFGEGASKELFVSSTPNFTASFASVRELERDRAGFGEAAIVYLPSANEWAYDRSVAKMSEYWTKELLDLCRRQLALRPLLFAPGRPSVAVHIRRGDLHRGESRATPNEYYYTVLEHVRHHLPDSDIHVWSSIESYSADRESGMRYWNASDFDGFRQRGMQVHLDSDTLLEPWSHMARARVLVTSQSSFSYVAAVLNPNCVIYPSNLDRPFEYWTDGKEEVKRKPDNGGLKRCLARGSDP